MAIRVFKNFKQFFKDNSISRDYLLIFAITMAVILISSLYSSYSIYNSRSLIKYNNLIKQTNRINRELNDAFDYVANLSRILGKDIINKGASDLNSISKILQGPLITSKQIKDQFSWALFDWSTPDYKMRVSTAQGIWDEPQDISYRNYAKMAKNEPWKLHFDQATQGISSGELVIPAGMGINDSQNNFVGVISLGFKVSELIRNIELVLNSNDISFILVDEHNNIALKSADVDEKNIQTFLSNNHIYNKIVYENFDEPIKNNDLIYLHRLKLDNYPFIILSGYNEAILNSEYNEILFPCIFGFTMIGMISFFLLTLIRYRIVSPIVKLAKIAEKAIIIDLNEDIKIPESKTKELKILSQQIANIFQYIKEIKRKEFELMSAKDQTETLNFKLKNLNSTLEHKVEERTRELSEALRAKTEFLNNMSHEVRTPIQGIVGISEGLVMQWDSYKEGERKFYASKIAENANRLISLVSNLLDLSRFTSGKMQFTFRPTDLLGIISDIIGECRDLYIRDKNITLSFETELESAECICDSERMIQLLRNIFANAIKFTPKGNIEARLERIMIDSDEGEIEGYKFTLKDPGIGIPIGEEESIFDPFIQSTRTKTGAGGTGLGLSICKQIIEGHGGEIRARNNDAADNIDTAAGTIIEFTIPKKARKTHIEVIDVTDTGTEDDDTDTDADTDTDTDTDTRLGFNNDNDANRRNNSNRKEESKDNRDNKDAKNNQDKAKVILFIDDEEASHISMEMMLANMNYKLIKAYSGEEGLEILKEYATREERDDTEGDNRVSASEDRIDLVLLDLMMPGIGGIKVLEEIRSDPLLKSTEVILQTGSSDEKELNKARSLHISNIISKPYDKSKIKNILINS